MWIAALVGFAFGFLGSVPVAGPIAVLVVTRGIDGKFRSGLWLAFGAALAESGYAFLSFWGFSSLLEEYDWVEPAAEGLAAAALIVLGILLVRKGDDPPRPDHGEEEEKGGRRLGGSFLTGFAVTALNPTLLATWTGAVTALFSSGLVDPVPSEALPFAGGVAVGIAIWFAVLLALIRRGVKRVSPKVLGRVIRITGFAVMGGALFFLVPFVRWVFT